MARPKLLPRRQVLLRIPEEVFAELLLLNPQLQDEHGFQRYGAVSTYFTNLIKRDLEQRRAVLRTHNEGN